MRITIRQKNLEITPALREYIASKLVAPVQKLLDGFPESNFLTLDLEFSRTTRHHHKGKIFYAEANLSLGKNIIRAESEHEDIRAACDALKDELCIEIKKFKEKALMRFRKGAREIKKQLREA